MAAHYDGVSVRILTKQERLLATSEDETPLVLESSGPKGARDVQEFLGAHSTQIHQDIAAHGAVLLRGFGVDSDARFEGAALSLRGVSTMEHVFMSEAGRTIVDGTRFVLHTNTNYKTGGNLTIGAIHTENYYAPDVPGLIFFSCQVPSWFGGETGLVNTARVYQDLPRSVRDQLERAAFFVLAWPLERVMARYGRSATEIEALCAEAGLSVRGQGDGRSVVMYKPSVLQHPITKEKALQINFSGELRSKGFEEVVHKAFGQDYQAWRWGMHRLSWRFPWLGNVVGLTPSVVKRAIQQKFLRSGAKKITSMDPSVTRIASAFDAESIELLGRSIRARFSSFTWRPGDMLLVDNVKMAHAGMPGFGPRRLRAFIANPIDVPCSPEAPGCYVIPERTAQHTLGERVVRTEHRRVA
jgi:alpha-ketoglutarate-dependent taurine dioxygenase